ncbi:MAG: hypothetical protein ACLP01_08690 [Solirubrobacteraceae bacterium]
MVIAVCASLAVLICASAAGADEWLPHPAGAKWQYEWNDNVFNPNGTIENVDVLQTQGNAFTLAWADPSDQIPTSTVSNLSCPSASSDAGWITLEDNDDGLINDNWSSCPAPAGSPILCPISTSCANSLSSALFNVIWGSRAPVLQEPLLRGTTWSSTGGYSTSTENATNSSTSTYLGLQTVKVPAYPKGVLAAVVSTQISDFTAFDENYASGTRTTWWVDGVGPVRVVFAHSGGGLDSYGQPPVTTVSLLSTNLQAKRPPSDVDYFPFVQGLAGTYKWTNSKHLPQPEVETVTESQVSGDTAAFTVKSVSGPMRAAGDYVFSLSLGGLSNLAGDSAAATLIELPPLGHGRHFFTPLDMMAFGFNPILQAYSQAGESWKSVNASDFHVYGVTGTTTVIGVRTVRVPDGTFQALEVKSVLTQRGYPYGSGVRYCWFAPGHGLVKLVFDHRDGSVSLIQLLK